MRHFRLSLLFTVVCIVLAFIWGQASSGNGIAAVTLTLLLGVMEISLSFDNAVVNASILKDMERKWRQLFLTVGILVAVFGMRLLFPILVVAVATSEGPITVARMALEAPEQYAAYLSGAHAGIAAFGGIFLFLVFTSFLFDNEKELHWLGVLEAKLAYFGKLGSAGPICALALLLLVQAFFPIDAATRTTVLVGGVGGIFLYALVDSFGDFFDNEDEADNVGRVAKRSGVMGLLYLEVLDASFSFDGVIGAFAITRDVAIIMLGLAVGAMFVRSMTVYLVEKGTLDEYVFLEHGAHYAIGALAFIMLGSIVWHVSEVVTGLIGVAFIVAAMASSLIYRKNNPGSNAEAG
ncbi:DUF475 domain-containing protein [Paraburkholderia hospita]|uniref:DUF475 domain-containing protein n=1 Tax=Paraburkholderia hospita TaxID=169430 RepID=UPI000B34A16D|nr:DUF475 domain-containing protein [Paraburkholderia hospita]OUL70309.1 hypothetical protein CA603_49315 [Paraburkholderia hospita]